jgi:hypothetical protein
MYAIVNRLLEVQDRLPDDEEKEEEDVKLQAQQILNFDPGTLKMLHDLSGHRNFTYTRKFSIFPRNQETSLTLSVRVVMKPKCVTLRHHPKL